MGTRSELPCEASALIVCARTPYTRDDAEQLWGPIEEGPDWGFLTELADGTAWCPRSVTHV